MHMHMHMHMHMCMYMCMHMCMHMHMLCTRYVYVRRGATRECANLHNP